MTDPNPYDQWFTEATRPSPQDPAHSPYGWQSDLGASTICHDRLIRIPTGYGKTHGVLGAWLYHRVIRKDPSWPRRLVWALPMRVLVEQTEQLVRRVLETLGLVWDGEGPHEGRVGIHVLMGGSAAGEWHLWPEAEAVLVGTQDMLLSRALNRGYGAGRARWPTDFGLVSQDALWVLDEVQLMDIGLATAAQLAAFRALEASKGTRPAYTWAMSATVQRNWLSKSPDTADWERGLVEVALTSKDQAAELWAATSKPMSWQDPTSAKALALQIADAHAALTHDAPMTLVVANTVDRARELYGELQKVVLSLSTGPQLHLLHSRFRGAERRAWWGDLLRPDSPRTSRIVVATQVIEAGVDISADMLFTELCPWPSLVQRLGRLARRGGTGRAHVIGLELPKQAAPYDSEVLMSAWDLRTILDDGSPRALAAFEANHPTQAAELYPYEPDHFLLREELSDLFDTTPDLTGADLDVSRYIRTGDERDVSVFWIESPPKDGSSYPPKFLRPTRDGLCAVPFLSARDWLFGKKSGDVEPRRLKEGFNAWVWDYLDGAWRKPERRDIWPGQVVLVDTAVGGYDIDLGWDGSTKRSVPVLAPETASDQEQADAAQDQEELSAAPWQTVGFHGGTVADQVLRIGTDLVPDELLRLLDLAARWHDLGKAHPAFQGAIQGSDRPARTDLAKAPSSAWRKGRKMYEISPHEHRPGFRHELASALGLFALLERHASPDHPSRLGELTGIVSGTPARSVEAPGTLANEVLALSPADFDLVAYLVCSHHGKLRVRLHSAPADQAARLSGGRIPLRGVCEGDVLPATALRAADGTYSTLPTLSLTLEPASLGLSPVTGRSWAERVDGVIARFGPFSLAWLEAILRAADVRASRDKALVDATLQANQVLA